MTYPTALISTTPPNPGLAVVQKVNDWLGALNACWSGPTAPTFAANGTLWLDTSSDRIGPRLRQRIAGAWRTIQSDVGTPIDDCDDAVDNGFYVWSESTLNSSASAGNGSMITARRSNGITQVSFRQSSGEADLISVRVSLNAEGTSWTPWRRVFTQADIVGTVRMSSGMPTGAIVESDTLSSGRFIRWADGTQICFAARTLSYASGSGLNTTWPFPKPFAATPRGNATLLSSIRGAGGPGTTEVGLLRLDDVTATKADIILNRILGATDFTSANTVSVSATMVGEWV